MLLPLDAVTCCAAAGCLPAPSSSSADPSSSSASASTPRTSALVSSPGDGSQQRQQRNNMLFEGRMKHLCQPHAPAVLGKNLHLSSNLQQPGSSLRLGRGRKRSIPSHLQTSCQSAAAALQLGTAGSLQAAASARPPHKACVAAAAAAVQDLVPSHCLLWCCLQLHSVLWHRCCCCHWGLQQDCWSSILGPCPVGTSCQQCSLGAPACGRHGCIIPSSVSLV